jgi:hypothetical protein|tara:strand:- start:1801 stop:1953 length:153 start_codon:yes stop_codon:yes gene_type:complete
MVVAVAFENTAREFGTSIVPYFFVVYVYTILWRSYASWYRTTRWTRYLGA